MLWPDLLGIGGLLCFGGGGDGLVGQEVEVVVRRMGGTKGMRVDFGNMEQRGSVSLYNTSMGLVEQHRMGHHRYR